MGSNAVRPRVALDRIELLFSCRNLPHHLSCRFALQNQVCSGPPCFIAGAPSAGSAPPCHPGHPCLQSTKRHSPNTLPIALVAGMGFHSDVQGDPILCRPRPVPAQLGPLTRKPPGGKQVLQPTGWIGI